MWLVLATAVTQLAGLCPHSFEAGEGLFRAIRGLKSRHLVGADVGVPKGVRWTEFRISKH